MRFIEQITKCSLLSREYNLERNGKCQSGKILSAHDWGIIDFRWNSYTKVARRNCIGAIARAWVTSDYVTSVSCRIIRLPTALSCCWDNGSIRMDHYPGLDVPGTLEINACIMIPTVLFHRRWAEEGTRLVRSWFTCPILRFESIVCHRKILLSTDRRVWRWFI